VPPDPVVGGFQLRALPPFTLRQHTDDRWQHVEQQHEDRHAQQIDRGNHMRLERQGGTKHHHKHRQSTAIERAAPAVTPGQQRRGDQQEVGLHGHLLQRRHRVTFPVVGPRPETQQPQRRQRGIQPRKSDVQSQHDSQQRAAQHAFRQGEVGQHGHNETRYHKEPVPGGLPWI